MKYPKMLICPYHYIKVKDPVYKYELVHNVTIFTNIKGYDIDLPYGRLKVNGTLTAKIKYRWDGPSGPTFDTSSSMRSSLFHDLIWQLIEEGFLPEKYRHYSNELLRDLSIEDGMYKFRAWSFYYTVDYVGRPYIKVKKWWWQR